jgi:hypothetical protein
VTQDAAGRDDGYGAVDTVAGLIAAAAIALAVVGLATMPARLTPLAILLALLAAAMSARWRTLAGVATAVAGLAWVVGMTIAVLTERPLF